jgi:hypothetical protein
VNCAGSNQITITPPFPPMVGFRPKLSYTPWAFSFGNNNPSHRRDTPNHDNCYNGCNERCGYCERGNGLGVVSHHSGGSLSLDTDEC